MFRYGVSDSRVFVFGSNIMQTHVPEGQPRGHPFCRCQSWLVGKELELIVPFDHVLGLEFYHKLNRIVVCDNLFFMRAKILRQYMQQRALGLLKVNVEFLLLLFIQLNTQTHMANTNTLCVCLLLQDLLQSCSRGGRRRVEDM